MNFQYSELIFLTSSISNWNVWVNIVIKDSPVAMCQENKYFGVILIEAGNYGIVLALFYKGN